LDEGESPVWDEVCHGRVGRVVNEPSASNRSVREQTRTYASPRAI